MNYPIVLLILASVLAVSLGSLSGVLLLSLKQDLLKKILLYLVSFAVGALFANVFFHLLPEAVELSEDLHTTFGIVLLGILFSFILEKCVHWHHCHSVDCHQKHPVGTMMLIGDGVHNITDGILIATSFLVDVHVGFATTIAVLLHEIPQEIGDFAVLIHSGYTRAKALIWNLISALAAVLGAAAVLILHDHIHNLEQILLPLVAGNFLYIAGSDLIPELHKEGQIKNTLLQLLCMSAGILLLYTMSLGAHGH